MGKKKYRDPAAFRQALDERIRKHPATDRRDRLRHQIVFERFMVRLQGEFGDLVTLKGGLAMLLRLETARTTTDVDIHLFEPRETLASRIERAAARGSERKEDWMTFEVREDRLLTTPGNKYGGQRFKVKCSIGGRPFGCLTAAQRQHDPPSAELREKSSHERHHRLHRGRPVLRMLDTFLPAPEDTDAASISRRCTGFCVQAGA